MQLSVGVIEAIARVEFGGGESVAVSHDKVLVLVHRSEELARRVQVVTARVNEALHHLGMSATCWIEPLSSDVTWLDEHLDGLTV